MQAPKTSPSSPLGTPRDIPLLHFPASNQQFSELIHNFQSCKLRVFELEQQLNLTRHNFQMQLNDMTLKHNQKTQLFLTLIKEMQDRHFKELADYKNQLVNYQADKIKMSNFERKMNQIGNGIEDIIQQSKLLSKANTEMEGKIHEKDRIIEQMSLEIQNLNEQINDYQDQIEILEKTKLKFIKRNKDIGELILEAEVSISSFTPNEDNVRASSMMCAATGHKSVQCNHCKLARLQKKYSELLN